MLAACFHSRRSRKETCSRFVEQCAHETRPLYVSPPFQASYIKLLRANGDWILSPLSALRLPPFEYNIAQYNTERCFIAWYCMRRKNVARRKMPACKRVWCFLCRRDEIIGLLKLILVAAHEMNFVADRAAWLFHSRRAAAPTSCANKLSSPRYWPAPSQRIPMPFSLCGTLANNFHVTKSPALRLRMWESIQVSTLRSEWGAGEFPSWLWMNLMPDAERNFVLFLTASKLEEESTVFFWLFIISHKFYLCFKVVYFVDKSNSFDPLTIHFTQLQRL